jgi:exonuclease SbcC
MKIILNQLQLVSFKGIRSLTIDFNDYTQDIHGANETGKSTVFNAFLWLLFGKDMEGRKDYEVKTRDENGREIEKLDHEVTGTFSIDGQTTVMRRTLKEKWVKPRGARESEFSGNETVFEWNGVPMREKDYLEKINGIMKEDVFKLLTNPLYFNTGLTGYKVPDWKARRQILVDLAGNLDDKAIMEADSRFAGLLAQLTGKNLEEYKAQISAQKKKLKDSLDILPARIDEAHRAIPAALDFTGIDRDILAKEKAIANLDESLEDIARAHTQKNDEQMARQNEIFVHKQQIQIIEQEIRSRFNIAKGEREATIRELRATGRGKDSELTNLNAELKRLEGQKSVFEARISDLRADWAKVDGKQPEPQRDDFKCPSCKQDLPAATVEDKNRVYQKSVSDFNENKVKRLGEITATGKELKTQLEAFNLSIIECKAGIEKAEGETRYLRAKITGLEREAASSNEQAEQTIASSIATHVDICSIKGRIGVIEQQIEASKTGESDNSEIKARRHTLYAELDELKKQRDTKGQIERGEKRVAELQTEEKDLAQRLADLEAIEFTIQEFTRVKIDTLESQINHKFRYARFKLFDRQVNGQEVECCETMYKGVVWGSMNTAARVLVGIDIINVLSAHYGVSAPIFLDNRESVTSIPDTDAQIVNLIVSPEDKKLRVA